MLCPVQFMTGSSSEQNVDTMDKKLTDNLWAVASNRDRENEEAWSTLVTRQATQVKSEELIDEVLNHLFYLVEDEQRPSSEPA